MRDQFSRLLEDSGLVPSCTSGDAVNYFSGNMELVKVSRGDDVYNFRIFYAFYEMTLLTYFQFFQKKKGEQTNNQSAKKLKSFIECGGRINI